MGLSARLGTYNCAISLCTWSHSGGYLPTMAKILCAPVLPKATLRSSPVKGGPLVDQLGGASQWTTERASLEHHHSYPIQSVNHGTETIAAAAGRTNPCEQAEARPRHAATKIRLPFSEREMALGLLAIGLFTVPWYRARARPLPF